MDDEIGAALAGSGQPDAGRPALNSGLRPARRSPVPGFPSEGGWLDFGGAQSGPSPEGRLTGALV